MSERRCDLYSLADDAIITRELQVKGGRETVGLTEAVAETIAGGSGALLSL